MVIWFKMFIITNNQITINNYNLESDESFNHIIIIY
jgi:hypothetical protein